jgi:hypothetical protein
VLAALGQAVLSELVVGLVECASEGTVVCALDDGTVVYSLDHGTVGCTPNDGMVMCVPMMVR